ncbi:MAG: hypothetical protein WB421_00060 [Terriglobales bacterium]
MEKEGIFSWLRLTCAWFNDDIVKECKFTQGNMLFQVILKHIPAGMKIERHCQKNKHNVYVTVWIEDGEFKMKVVCMTCCKHDFNKRGHESPKDKSKRKKGNNTHDIPSDYEFACQLTEHLDECCWFVPSSNAWYAFNGKTWIFDKTGSFIRNKINEILVGLYEGKDEIIKCLESSVRRDHIVKECKMLLEKTDFLSILDSNMQLVGFKNGIYDLQTMPFRPPKSTDYVSMSTGCDFVDVHDVKYVQIFKEVVNFFGDVCVGEMKMYNMLLKIMASAYNGTKRKQLFFIWAGSKNPPSFIVDY